MNSRFDLSVYTVSLEIAAWMIGILCYAHVSSHRSMKLRRTHYFLMLTLTLMLAAITDIGFVFLDNVFPGGFITARYVLHLLFFAFHAALPAYLYAYILQVNGLLIGRRISYYMISFAPFMILELAILTNPLTGAVFVLRGGSTFVRGTGGFLLYLIPLFYLTLSFVILIRTRRLEIGHSRRTFAVYLAIAAGGPLVELLMPKWHVELFCEALALLGFMLTVENEEGQLDRTTKLYNRDVFEQRTAALNLARQNFVIIYIGLLNMALYNRILSIEQGDALRRSIADFLCTVVEKRNVFRHNTTGFALLVYLPERDTVRDDSARDKGGYSMLFPRRGAEDDSETELRVQSIINRLTERFHEPWDAGGTGALLQTRIEVIRVPQDARNAEELQSIIENDFPEDGSNVRVIRGGEDFGPVRRKAMVEKVMRTALEADGFEVWFQPIWSAREDQIIAAEALVRLPESAIGPVYPDEFIPIAEKNGMILDIGELVFERVCRFIHDNPLETLGMKYIEINLSLYQFTRPDLVERLEEIRTRYKVPVSNINLEITESAPVGSSEGMLRASMEELRNIGYTFSLDDYGSGYSNLQRLISGSFTNIKIDKSILYDAERRPESETLLKNLTAVIRELHLNVIQEGVENKSQLDRVLSYGCNLIQGFYFSKPAPADEYLRYVKSYNRVVSEFQ